MIKTKAIIVLILASLVMTSFGSAPVWGGDEESSRTILPQSVKDGLSQRCNVGEIVRVYNDYAAKISTTKMEVQPSPAETTPQLTPDQTAPQLTPDTAQVQLSNDEVAAQLNQLREEIRAIVEKCVTKELQNLKCPTNACDAGAFAQQATRIARDYFANEELATICQYNTWPRGEDLCDQLFKQVKECLEKLFNDCGCDIECLKCLVSAIYSDGYYLQLANRDGYSNVLDYMLEWTGPLGLPGDFPMDIQEERPGGLIDRILKKLKECGYRPQESEQFTPPEREQTTTTELPIPGREEADKDKEAQAPFVEELKKLAEETGKAVGGKEADKQKEVEDAFKMLEKLLEDAKGKEEKAGEKDESASKLPRVTVMMLSEVGLTEDEEAFSPIDFFTSAPRIDVSMFKAITENTEAEAKIAAAIISETSEEAREITIEVIGSEVILKDEDAEAKTTLPLVIKENKLYAGQDGILYPISLLPGDIEAGLEIQPVRISLEHDRNKAPAYEVLLEEKAKLIFLPLDLTREVTVDPASGEVRSIKQPWWSSLVSKNVIPVKVAPPPTVPKPVTPITESCPCPKLTEYKICCNYVCRPGNGAWDRSGIVVYIRPPADVKDSCSYQYHIDWGDGSKPYESAIYLPPYAGNDENPYCTLYGHEYQGTGNYRLTVKVFNKCDERTKTFKVPIYRPECNELVDNSLKDVNFDSKQFLDQADRLDGSSLFGFVNQQLYPLRNLPGRTVTDPVHGTKANICHVLVDIKTKGIDPFKAQGSDYSKEHIAELVKFHTLFSIFGDSNRVYKKTDEKDGSQVAYYEEGENAAKVVYVPGKEPFFSLIMVFRSDCDCSEENMRYRIISNLTSEAAEKATSEAKENLKGGSTAIEKYYSKRIVEVSVEIGVCCPPGECK